MATEIMEKDASFLLSMDKRFKLEKALIDNMVDGGGEQLMKDMITKALPSDTATIDVNKSVAEIAKIARTMSMREPESPRPQGDSATSRPTPCCGRRNSGKGKG